MTEYRPIIIVFIAIIFAFSGCSVNSPNKIKIGVVDWPESRCMTEVVKIVLEDEMDYQVEIMELDIDSVFKALAENNCDIFLDCWLPITHEKFIFKYGSEIENLGINYRGARTGLVVPSYVPIRSIEQLNEFKDKFKSTIVGIEPDSGIIRSTQKAIKEYHLDFNLQALDSDQMAEKLEEAVEQGEWIVVTGWSPHWKFAKWDLKYLDDPLFIYGAEESLHTITRKGFAQDYPRIAEFLYNFSLSKEQLAELLLFDTSNLGEESNNSFSQWISENRTLVDRWLIDSL